MSRFLSDRFIDLEEYVPGEQPQDKQYIKLNTNESPYPPSPRVFEAVNAKEVSDLRLYPDPNCTAFMKKLAEFYDVKPENLFIGNGSDEVLSFAFMAFCDSYRGAAFADITYGFYSVFADLYGIDARIIPLKDDFTLDVDAFCGIERMVVLANPNAPTGIAISVEDIEKIVSSNRDHIVIVDEAYVDFGAESCYKLIYKYDNLLVVRTYSKSRSMAGARLGFAFGSKAVINDLVKIKYATNPYNINRLTLVAGSAAIDDDVYYKQNCMEIIDTRQQTAQQLRNFGFEVTDSLANFLFVKSPDIGGRELYHLLKDRGILVRHFQKERIGEYLRITVGTSEDMQVLIRVVSEILQERNG